MPNPFSKVNFIKAPVRYSPSAAADAPMFRKRFTVKEPIQTATVHVCGLGYAYYYLNGTPVSPDLFTAPVSDYTKTLWYNSYDVTTQLQQGENIFAVICGNGFYNEYFRSTWEQNLAPWRDNPKFILVLEVNGKVILNTDDSWRCSPTSAIIYNQLRSGEHFDARLYDPNWNTYAYDDSSWKQAKVDSKRPTGTFRLCPCEPIQEDCIYPAKTMTKMDENRYIFDIGQNLSGYIRLQVNQPAGDELIIRYAERLSPDGEMDFCKTFTHYPESEVQQDRVICSGAPIIWSPKFAYHGFRYIEITGLKNPTLDTASGVFVHQMVAKKSSFSCSDPLLNALFHAGQMSTLSNMFYMPTDCPTREKLGWINDVQASVEQFLTNFHAERFFEKYLQDVYDAMLPNGQMPGYVPASGWGYDEWNGPVCEGVLFELPYRLYLHTGNADHLIHALPYFDRYLEYLEYREDENGDVTYGLDDWIAPNPKDKVGSAFVNSAYRVKFLRIACLAAELAGIDTAQYESKLTAQISAHIRKYLNPDGTCNIPKQTAVAMLIYHNIYNDLAPLAAQLKQLVEEKDFHHDCGMVGLRHLYMALNKCGLHDYAYRIVTAHGFPSYRYWYEDEMTTLFEAWDSRNASHNHHMLSDFMSWMMKTILGIQPTDPGCSHISLDPHYFDGLSFATGHIDYPSGKVSVQWHKTEGLARLTVTISGSLTVEYRSKVLSCGTHTFETSLPA